MNILLDELRLKNFRNHRDLTIAFTEGVTGITGGNGSGKTSVLEAFEFLCTGKLADTKEQCITEGASTGFVSGKFTIEGKEAKLCRQLGESKASLEYDGKKYSKAADIKKLWETLFQIDEAIFSNIIIAHQKEIPFLFSGDAQVRERVFQKIFLVPNTQKLRTIIWDGYLKNAPPEMFVEAEDKIKLLEQEWATKQATLTAKQVVFQEEQQGLISSGDRQKMMETISKIMSARESLKKLPQFVKDIEQTSVRILELAAQQEADLAQKNTTDPLAWATEKKHLYAQREQIAQQQNFLLQKKQLETQLTGISIDDLTTKLKSQEDEINETAQLLGQLEAKQKVLRKNKELFSTIPTDGDKPCCPTCKQEVPNPAELIAGVEQDLKFAQEAYENILHKLNKLKTAYTQANKDLNIHKNNKAILDKIKIDPALPATFDEARLSALEGLERSLQELLKAISVREVQIDSLKTQRATLIKNRDELTALPAEALLEQELNRLQKSIQDNDALIEKTNALSMEIKDLQRDIATIQNTLNTNEDNKKKNAVKKIYTDALQKIYDVLHISNFPRRLASSYVGEVETNLCNFLQRFNFPYRVQVSDGFKLVVRTASGFQLPRVSGGEEMVIGLCLRLALHTMFSQSFPLLVIDEGTTHMDNDNNKTMYFDMLRNIRKMLGIKQILVIDHDAGLADVADSVIQLKK